MKREINIKHLLFTAIPFFILGVVFFVIPLDNLLFGRIDNFTDTYMTNLSIKAGSAFGIARALNAIISVAQSVSVEFFASVNIGAVLDPLNDLIEKFSNVMLWSLASTGIQLIIFHIGKAIGLKWFLSLCFVSASLARLCKYFCIKEIGNKAALSTFFTFFNITWKTLLILFFILRLFIPFVSFVGKSCEPYVMEKYDQANKKLEKITESSRKEIGVLQYEKETDLTSTKDETQLTDIDEKEKGGNIFTRFFNSSALTDISKEISKASASLNVKKILNNLIDSISDIVPYVIDLIIVFLLQTVVIPITVLLLMRYFLWPFVKNIFETKTTF